MNKTPSEMTQQELYLEIARLAKENDKLKRTKKFGLVWENKNDAKVEEVRRSAPILLEDSSKRVINDPNDVNHVLINGDNFQAMTALRATHAGKVDVIYIDPPYNTGNKDFIYNDKFVDAEDGYRHSLWLSFMQKRLILARELLSETGVIFVSIDDNEQARLKLLMDDIFGAKNFLGTITWTKKTKPANQQNARRRLQANTEYILTFVKSKESHHGFDVSGGAAKNYPHVGRFGACRFEGFTNKSEGMFKREKSIFPILGIMPPEGRNWKIGQAKAAQLIADGKIEIVNGEPKIAVYPEDDNVSIRPFWAGVGRDYGTAEQGKALLGEILKDSGFETVKPVPLIKEMVSRSISKDGIILDFFAGSGTTAHAVAELNKEDGGRRQCILITDGGKTETSGESSKNASENAVHIAEEITYERVKRVLTGKGWADGKEHEPLGGNLFYLNTVMKYVGTIDAKSKEPYFCPSNSTAFSLDTGVWHPILEEVGEFTEWPFQKRDYKLFALPKGEDGKQNYALTINTSDWEFTAFKEWFDKNMPEDSTVFLYADSFSHAGCEWMEELEMVKDPRLAEVNITKRLINNHNWVAHSFLKTDI